MSRVVLACAFVALLPVAARGEPISITHSESGGFGHSGDVRIGTLVDLGTLFMPGPDAEGTLFFDDVTDAGNYTLAFNVSGLSGIRAIQVELLNPRNGAGGGGGGGGASASDFWSFSPDSGLGRSIAFVGGSPTLMNQITHRGNILILGGLIGADQARIALEMRNEMAGRGFQVRFSGLAQELAPVPEPASMLLVGSGLAGLAGMYRRRRSATNVA